VDARKRPPRSCVRASPPASAVVTKSEGAGKGERERVMHLSGALLSSPLFPVVALFLSTGLRDPSARGPGNRQQMTDAQRIAPRIPPAVGRAERAYVPRFISPAVTASEHMFLGSYLYPPPSPHARLCS